MGYLETDTVKMTLYEDHGDWNFGFCENCMKNAGDRVRMIREKIDGQTEMFVCTQCGSTKRF